MDDNAPKENPPVDFNKLDLTQLQGFSFGTQWTQDKSSPSDRRERDAGSDRPRRDDRRDGPGGAPANRDRRAFRKPAGPGEAAPNVPAGPGGGAPERREYAGGGGGGPRRDGPGGYAGGPRRDGPGGGGGYQGGGPRYGGGRGEPQERPQYGPYDSPYFAVTFYPEDTSFNTLVQTIRKSCRTIELFEIARTVVAKTDRFVVVVARKPTAESAVPAVPADAAAKAAKAAFHISVPDALPFESDEAAVAHVLANHLDKFFDKAEVEVDPPKGNYQVINKCGITGELLGPPNYHRYSQIVQQHHAAKVARMSLEAFRSRIETIRDPEVVNQWLEKMKKTTRYTWKLVAAPVKAAAVAPAAEAPPAAEAAPAAEGAAETPATEAAAAPVAPTFDSLEDARVFLLTQARDKVVRTTESARFHGKVAETMPPGEIRRAIEGALERQRKFPLDTANALRGRLRREHFTIFKKGSKGVSYVCAVKRKFRVPGQTFADSIGSLISYVEGHPMIRASELSTKFLGIKMPAPAKAPAPVEAPVPATDGASETAPAPAAEAAPAPAAVAPVEPTLTIEERAKLARLQGDLVWLVREGYVTEFIDGRLFAPPPMVEARKKEVEGEEHDPENFPEIPASAPEAAPVAETPAAEMPAPVVEQPVAETPVAETEAPMPVAETPAAAPVETAVSEPAPAPVAEAPAAAAVEEPKRTEPTA